MQSKLFSLLAMLLWVSPVYGLHNKAVDAVDETILLTTTPTSCEKTEEPQLAQEAIAASSGKGLFKNISCNGSVL